MNPEKILTHATKIIDALNHDATHTARNLCAELVEEAKNEINATTARAACKKGIHAAAMRILKSASNAHPLLTKANATPDGVTVCNGFSLVKFNASDAPPLPVWDEKNAAHYLNAENLLKPASENQTPATLPTPSELKSYIKTEKATRAATAAKHDRRARIYYTIPEGVTVDALFLLDVLESLPDCVARITCREYARATSTIYFEAPNGRGLLCPVRVNNGGGENG